VIRRLQVRGYKSLVDSTLELDRLAVIVGPNGAGKSNLIDLIQLLSRLVSRESVREAFDGQRGRPAEAFHAPTGFGAVSSRTKESVAQRTFTVVCDIELGVGVVESVNGTLAERERIQGSDVPYTRVSERLLRYSLTVGLRPATGELTIEDERLEALKRDGTPKESRPAFVERQMIESKPRFVARIERQSHPRYFETSRPRTLLSELSDPVYHPHVVAAAREIASWRVYYVEPSRMRADLGVQSADDPGRHGELLPAYYYTLQTKHPATFRGILRNLRDLIEGMHDLRVDVRENAILEIVAIQKTGAEFPARLLSEGTLRLMAIIGLAVAPHAPSVVVYEEPENGVNPSRLNLIVDIVRRASLDRRDGPQFILTTHSALLCRMLAGHLIGCTWSAPGGTKFRRLELDPQGLFTEDEIAAALEHEAESRKA
jgi:predicted ATPase